jgi:hypothetical protein
MQLSVFVENVFHREVDDPLGVQVVVDHLCLSNFYPDGVLLVADAGFKRTHWV